MRQVKFHLTGYHQPLLLYSKNISQKNVVIIACGIISLMSHMLKAFLRIIHARIRSRCEEDLADSQFGFRNAFGTREALFGKNLQKCRDQRKDVFACFIDYEKVFDRVQHDKLVNMLRGGLD